LIYWQSTKKPGFNYSLPLINAVGSTLCVQPNCSPWICGLFTSHLLQKWVANSPLKHLQHSFYRLLSRVRAALAAYRRATNPVGANGIRPVFPASPQT